MESETEEGRSASGRPETGFEINGEYYRLPQLDSITLDEERILYIYADVVLQDFAPAHPDMPEDDKLLYEAMQGRKVRNPEFKRALAHIAYRREHPDVDDEEMQKAIGLVSSLQLDIEMLREDEDRPPETSQKPPSSESDSSPLSRSTDSGRTTENGSAQVVELHERTGTIESATSSPGAVPTGLVS